MSGSRPGRNGNRWVRIDRRYNNPYRLTGYAWRVILKWGALLIVWVTFLGSRNLFLEVIATAALIAYSVVRVRRYQQASQPAGPQVRAAMGMQAIPASAPTMRFNPPPGWPPAPAGWAPPPGWQPDPSWPPVPAGWQLWVPGTPAPLGERNSRTIPQDVKIAVAARDGGRCRQCGSTQDLHYDHVIPWSKGGANTASNIQLLCGYHNRLKGADDIPV
jgi:HNH endonuclease